MLDIEKLRELDRYITSKQEKYKEGPGVEDTLYFLNFMKNVRVTDKNVVDYLYQFHDCLWGVLDYDGPNNTVRYKVWKKF